MARRFSGRSLSLFVAWQVAALGYLVGQLMVADVQLLGVFLFYFLLVLSLLSATIALGILNRKQEEVRDLLAMDAASSAFAIVFGAFVTLLILLPIVWRQGFRPIGLDLILLQAMIIVPSEEYAFRFFLPRILPGRLILMPSWVWAQGVFAGFHYRAFGLDPWAMLMAFVFGLGLYLIVDAGRKYRLLGLGAAIGIHFVWNFIALSAGDGTAASVIRLVLSAIGL